ncbi:MAG: FKBP-type peptidyl-prolyl cis-trans isomerase [Eggerthellaceae bacterium]|nr:FKBP-type peptidyl-prolyl cis-trans isomerase [Eggerthellaceae bacterium]
MRNHLERNGMTACVRYEGGVIGQPAIDTTEGNVKRIEMGAGVVPIGIENALFDMEVGETRVVDLSPREAFGEYDENAVQTVLRDFVPNGHSLEEGSLVGWRDPHTGQVMPVRVTMATKDYVTLDHNHPFAGQNLRYTLELVGLE